MHYVHMVAENIATSRSNLSSLLKQVRQGETVIVLDRDIPIARLEAIDLWSDEMYKLMAGRLTKAGDLLPRKKKLSADFFDLPLPEDNEASVRNAVLSERNEGW